jgi:hypothetical protein
MAYEDSMKYYRDLKNSLDTKLREGERNKAVAIAKIMLLDNEPMEKIVRYTQLSIDEIKRLEN